MAQQVTKVSSRTRKDPLTDFNTLTSIGRDASKAAKAKAFEQGLSVTIARSGRKMKLSSDGSVVDMGPLQDTDDFPSLEQDLCQD